MKFLRNHQTQRHSTKSGGRFTPAVLAAATETSSPFHHSATSTATFRSALGIGDRVETESQLSLFPGGAFVCTFDFVHVASGASENSLCDRY